MNFTKTTFDNWFLEYFRLFKEIAPPRMLEYGGYFTGKPSAMASSLESLIAFANRVEDPNALILDAGAGASTWVLRKMFPNVISTDPDPEYLAVVAKVCKAGGLNTDGFFTEMIGNPFQVDYTYYDYGNAERQPHMIDAILGTRKLIYLDDTDDRPDCAKDRAHVYMLAEKLGLKIEDCREANDQYGRWGVIITKSKPMKKVVSYALFGNHVTYGTRQFYWDHIPATVRAHHNLLPDWELRIHVDSLYNDDRAKLLRAFEKAGLINVVHAEENIACCRSMLWRMMPVWDREVSHVMCRDIDSIMCPKDVKVITRFVESGAALSAVNDNPAHSVTMMGGMVGFNTAKFLEKSPWPTWLAMIQAGEGLERPSGGYDQILMSDKIWGRYYPDVCAHRFSGMPQDSRMTFCTNTVPEGPIPGLDPEMCRLADTLMPYLGTCGYPIDKAIEIFDKHGNPEVMERVVIAETYA